MTERKALKGTGVKLEGEEGEEATICESVQRRVWRDILFSAACVPHAARLVFVCVCVGE